MKNLFITLFMLTISFATYAKPLVVDTIYYQQPTLHKFDGIWEYKSNNITFRIVLVTEKVSSNGDNVYFDQVSGYHLYIKDNKTVQNSIGKQKTLKYGHYWNKEVSKNVLFFTFTDLGRPLPYHVLIEMLPDGRLKWKLKNMEGIRFINNQTHQLDDKDRDDSFHVPNNLILTKVK